MSQRHYRGDGHDHSVGCSVGLVGCVIALVWLVVLNLVVWAVLQLVPAIVRALGS
jgi:hypothetical protein